MWPNPPFPADSVTFIEEILRPLLVESSVIVIFYAIFLMRYAVIINYYFGKIFFSNYEKRGGKQLF